jgi:regulator of sigma E protease
VKITGMNPEEDIPDDVRPRAYYNQPVWKRIVVIAAGPAMNLLVAFILMLVFFWLIGPQEPTTNVAAVKKGAPAVGQIRPGDRIVSVDGKGGDPLAISKRIQSHRCANGLRRAGCRAAVPATVVVRRSGKLVTLRLKPAYDTSVQPAAMRLGFTYDQNGPRRTLGFGKAVNASADEFWFITKNTVTLPARLFNEQQRKQITGIVGASKVTQQTIADNTAQVVLILAVISLSLAIVNLFPFLPLDGGHIFWALVEKVRRKPVPYRVMEQAGVVGFMLVIGLFVIGLTNDIGRLAGHGFNTR